MTKLDLTTLSAISGGATYNNSADNGGIAIQGNGNTVYAGNSSSQSSNSGSSRKS